MLHDHFDRYRRLAVLHSGASGDPCQPAAIVKGRSPKTYRRPRLAVAHYPRKHQPVRLLLGPEGLAQLSLRPIEVDTRLLTLGKHLSFRGRATDETRVDPIRRRLLKTGVWRPRPASSRCRGSAVRQRRRAGFIQLSWIKSIQYGGFFAGVEQEAQEIRRRADLRVRRAERRSVANVGAVSRSLGDRPLAR